MRRVRRWKSKWKCLARGSESRYLVFNFPRNAPPCHDTFCAPIMFPRHRFHHPFYADLALSTNRLECQKVWKLSVAPFQKVLDTLLHSAHVLSGWTKSWQWWWWWQLWLVYWKWWFKKVLHSVGSPQNTQGDNKLCNQSQFGGNLARRKNCWFISPLIAHPDISRIAAPDISRWGWEIIFLNRRLLGEWEYIRILGICRILQL